MAKSKKFKQSHTDNVKHGMGDFYGTGKKNPIAKPKSIMGLEYPSKKKLKIPPRALA